MLMRYAYMAFKSSSLAMAYMRHGIGGSSGRPVPPLRPLPMAARNVASLQLPMPVVRSGVRFVVNETPHGPDHAVFVSLIETSHPPAAGRGAFTTTFCG